MDLVQCGSRAGALVVCAQSAVCRGSRQIRLHAEGGVRAAGYSSTDTGTGRKSSV